MEPNDDDLIQAFAKIKEMPFLTDLEMIPLKFAVKMGLVDIIQQHLDNGAHVNEELLKLSLLSGEIEAVKLLLKNGADPNISAGNLALESNEYIIDYLVNRGTGLNMSENNFPTLLQFALIHHEEMFIELLSKGMSFDVNVRNSESFSLLQQAAENNNMKLVEILVDYGAKIELIPEPHYSPLLCAVSNKNLEMVNFFLDRGASMYFRSGRTAPFLNAIANDDLEMVKLFLSRGVDVNAKYSHLKTPLHSICDPYEDAEYESEDDSENETEEEEKLSKPNRQEIFKLLLDHGANVNSQNHYKSTPLHKACARKRAGDVQMLLTRGINFDTSCYEKCTILHSIKCKKIWKVIELRKPVSTSVDPEQIDLHLSFVDASNMLKNLKRLYYFLGSDVDVDIRNVLNRTAIYYATRRNCCDIIENLLKYLPNVNVADDKGHTPLMCAFGNHIKEAVPSKQKAIELLTAIIAVRKVINEEEDDVQKIDSKLLECIPFIKDQYAKCEMEIHEMKDKWIADRCYVRFFDFLSQDINKLAKFTENRKIMRYLYSEKYKEDFPIYQSLLERKIQLAELRGKLLQVSQLCFQTLAEQNEMPILPSFVVRRILSDLGDIDLLNFLEGASFQRFQFVLKFYEGDD